MIFLDSTYLIAIIFTNDKYHQRAIEIKKIIEYEKKIINNTVLNEVLNSLGAIDDEKVKKIINSIYNIDEIYYLSKEDYQNSVEIFHNYDYSINFSDCTILETMFKKRINTIVSFDSDFRKLKGLNIIR